MGSGERYLGMKKSSMFPFYLFFSGFAIAVWKVSSIPVEKDVDWGEKAKTSVQMYYGLDPILEGIPI